MKKIIVLQASIFILFCGFASFFGQNVPEEAKQHFDRGMAAVEKAKIPEDYEAAIKEFEQVEKLAPKWPAVSFHLALAQEKAEKYSAAVKSLQRYLWLAPHASDAEEVEILINKLEYKFAKSVDVKTWEAIELLHEAAANGKKDLVELLIARGADVNARDEDDDTPLHEAARRGQKDVVGMLIAKGTDVNAKNKDSMTPLHTAAEFGQKEVAELLIAKGAAINARDKDGQTPLYYAESNSHTDVAELLRKLGAR